MEREEIPSPQLMVTALFKWDLTKKFITFKWMPLDVCYAEVQVDSSYSQICFLYKCRFFNPNDLEN